MIKNYSAFLTELIDSKVQKDFTPSQDICHLNGIIMLNL